MMKRTVRCSECEHKELLERNGGANRYYCVHPKAQFVRSECEPTPMICRTVRHSTEMTVKTSPAWCPLKQQGCV